MDNNTVSIVVIGKELLVGQVIDTNSGEIARAIRPLGLEVGDVQVVADSAEAINRAINRAMELSSFVITTGGLGPTSDDITKQTLCDRFGGKLIENKDVANNIQQVFARRRLTMNTLTMGQAMVPSSCEVIANDVGTAPAMRFCRDGKVLVALPGVPHEMSHLLKHYVLDMLASHFNLDHPAVGHRYAISVGVSESELAMRLSDWENELPPYITVAYLPTAGHLRLRLDGHHSDSAHLDAELDRQHSEMCRIIADNLLTDTGLSIQELLIDELRRHNLTFASAESCTGGNISHTITLIAGCSDVFVGGVTAYANEVKTAILGVDELTIATHGAVSRPVVEEMVAGVCRATKAQCGVATSGIAGPGGGTPDKPVGTVAIGVATPGGIISEVRHFTGSRQRIIDQATATAIIMAIKQLRLNRF